MPKEFIVAIELGSSKITGIAGKKNLDGSISILAVVQEDSASCIRKGVVYNIDKTVMCVTNIVKKLETTLKSKIAQVYVGVGGQSIRSIKNVILREMGGLTVVTPEMINELMDQNRNSSYPEQEILDAATQEYKVDQQYQLDPVGIQCSRLEAGITIAEMYLAPLAMADSVLTETEKRSGCVLVDLGADTTTVSVYNKNILRHLAVIPLGGNNITKDIATLQMEENEAERMKLKYGSAYTDNSDIDNSLSLPIDQERNVFSRDFINIVEARVEEIIENAWFQVPNEYIDKLLGGIILTGGGSNMKNIERAFRNHTHIEKIRVAKFVTTTINSNLPEINAQNGRLNTVLGILEKGDMNCAGEEITGDLFDNGAHEQHESSTPRTIRQPNEITGMGIVQTEEEKKAAEEEARRRREEEEEAERQRLAEEEAEARRIKRENSTWNRLWRSVKNFGGKIIEDETE